MERQSEMKAYFIAGVLLLASLSFAQENSWTVSAGYSNLHIGRAAPNLNYDKDGGYIDGDVNWLFPTEPAPLLLGVGVSGAGHYEDESFSNGEEFFIFGPTSDVSLYSIEGRIGTPIQFRSARGWFLLPRIGAGLLIDDYAIDTPIHTEYHTGAAFEIRPTLQAGYSWGWGSVGGEVSYMAAWGDFGRLGNAAQELRIGAFLRFRF